ncbi:MAG: hypothetical protein H0T44_13845 [Gemmatimonadales bacterium]|nr:hypothetical protein [Gemmatimonadales bacterium]
MPRLTFHLIPHTHWDREWYLTSPDFLARLVPALDELLDQLDGDPGFRSFLLDGQTVLLNDYLEVRPGQRERVRKLVTAGRLQVGPWYVLADEMIPSAESLVRNLLAGRADAESLGGRNDVLYSPDAFGHPAALPALAGEFGIRYGVLWRGLGGEPGQLRDLYRWRAPSGHELLVYHLPPGGYEIGAALPADTDQLPAAWSRVRSEVVSRAATSQVAVFVGADHHAAHPAIGGLRDLLQALEPESRVQVSRLHEFFSAAEAAGAELPLLQGELRWSYGYTWTLQGVHSTRAPLKRRHAEAELMLERIAEPLAALASRHGALDVRPLLGHAWHTLLQCQFHDSIAGCTADPVAERVERRIEDAATFGRAVARAGLDALTGNRPDHARDHPEDVSPQLLIWNPVPRERGGVVIADLTWFRRDVLVGPPGGREPRRGDPPAQGEISTALGGATFQVLGRFTAHERLDSARHYPDQDQVHVVRVACTAPPLGGFALTAPAPGSSPRVPVRVEPRRLDNGLVEVVISPTGTLGLHDRRGGARFGDLLRLESGGDLGDSYTYAPPVPDRLRRMAAPVRTRVLAEGPLVGAIEVRGTLTAANGSIGVRLVVTLHAGSAAIRCTLELDNQASDHRLRLSFPTGVAGAPSTAGGPFGSVTRQPAGAAVRNYPRETPVATAPAQRFVAAAANGRGLAVLAPGFFEYELTHGGELLVTLLRCVGQLSREDLSTRPGHAGWPVPTPLAQCRGRERLQFGLSAVTEEDVALGTTLPALWEDLFLPPRGLWLRQATPLQVAPMDLRLEGAGLVFSSLKPAEAGNGMVLRCYNATGGSTEGAWRIPFPVSAVHRVRADEREPTSLPAPGGGGVRFSAGPHEIVTLRLEVP